MGSEPPVYQPAEDTWLLIDCLSSLTGGGLVVEVGCGSGEVSRNLAERGVEVVAIDISQAATKATRQNCLNLLDHTHIVVGDKLKALRPSGKIRLIVSNPPYLPSEDTADVATEAGPTGAEFAISLIDDAEQLMEMGSRLVLIASTLGNAEAIVEYAEKRGLIVRCVASRRLFFEEIRCYEVWKKSREE
ncbi:MAG: methyltransferase [Nitrososphaerota archaeon]|nr:UPF0146 family protein [Candidatus Calditenuaceae archaeon]MDW8073891.1 methyltransferase [Nitrososphaerota archaeon]